MLAAAPDAAAIVLSDHGFGPIHQFLVFNVWLLQQGYLQLRSGLAPFGKRALFELGLTPALGYRLSMKLGLARMRLAAGVGTRTRLIERINRLFLSLRDVDWSRTQVYSKGNYGQLFLNLRGREPFGCVEPGEEARVVREQLIADLRELRDPETGEPLIGPVWRAEELYAGPFLDRAPDVTFLPADMRDKALGTVDFTSSRFVEPVYGNSGDHRMNGIFFMRGEGVKAGGRLTGASLLDVAPTVLHYLGEGVPADFDGRSLMEIFTAEEQARNPLRTVAASGDGAAGPGAGGRDLTPAEQDEIRARLKGLGYLG